MENILFLAHTDENGRLPKAALETLGAAIEIKSQLGKGAAGAPLLSIGVIGQNAPAALESLGGAKADKYYQVTGADFACSRSASDTAALEAIVRASGATLILAAATSRFNRALPGLALRLGGRIDTHISGLTIKEGQLNVQRWYYRQRMLATLTRAARPWFLTVDSGVFAAYQGAQGVPAPLEKLDVTLTETLKKTKVIGLKTPSADAQTIRPDAKLLLVAGVGWTKKQPDGQTHSEEAARLILDFLAKTKASLGSSKSLVDQSGEGEKVFSFMSQLNQVGQTGATPRHPKGLSTCCHGEEPHVVGWRFINDRRAVNLDPNCGWAQGKADVLYVADAFKVIEKVNALLK